MYKFSIRNFIPEYIPQLNNLQIEYNRLFPQSNIVPEEIYCSPGYEHGKNIFCVFDLHDRMVGFAPVFPVSVSEEGGFNTLPHIIWTNILTEMKSPDLLLIREILMEKIINRAVEIKKTLPEREAKLCFCYFSTEQPNIDFVSSKGFTNLETIYTMSRCLQQPITDLPMPENIEVKDWKMPTEDEQREYINSYNRAFPGKPWNIDELKYFMTSNFWTVGTTKSAFSGGKLTGSVMVYWDEDANLKSDKKTAFTEQIFVLPEYRNKGIASYLINKALLHLKIKGIDKVFLEVKTNNLSALSIYIKLGYKVVKEQLIMEKLI